MLCEMVRAGCDADTMASVIMDRDFGISASVLEKPNPRRYAARQVDKVWKKTQAEPSKSQAELPIIYMLTGQLPRMLDEAEAALLRAASGIYQRSGELVRVCRLDSDGSDENATHSGTLTIRPVVDHWLREEMMRIARWRRPIDDGKWVPAEPALRDARTFMARVGSWRLPILAGIVETPTLRADGTVLATLGYDHSSHLILDTGAAVFPPVADQPSKDAARAALDRLIQPFRAFPFVPDEASADWKPEPNGASNRGAPDRWSSPPS